MIPFNILLIITTSQIRKQNNWNVNVLYEDANSVAEKPIMNLEPKPRILRITSVMHSLRFVLYSDRTDKIIRINITIEMMNGSGFYLTGPDPADRECNRKIL